MAPKRGYSQNQMDLALQAVTQGMPVATAAKLYNVPRTTLLDKKMGRTPISCKMGPPSILSPVEEEILVQWILLLAQKHQPVTREQLMDSVQMIIKQKKKQTPFTDGRPGKKWFAAFLKRHPQISTRIAQNLTPARENVTESQIRRWFKEIQEYLISKNLIKITEDPKRVFNADESAFFLQPKGEKVLAKKGDKSIYMAGTNDDKENLTVLVTANGEGDFAPPMIIFKYERIPGHIAASVNKDWGLGRSETGWMCGATFYEYITNVFVPWLDKKQIERPIILFIDGHVSHLTYHLSNFCTKNQIEIIALFPNSTHLIQPMDVAVFRPLKSFWKKAVRQFHVENNGERLRKEHFAKLLESALSAITKDTVKNGFKACGLVPFSADSVKFSKISSNHNFNNMDSLKLKEKLKILESLIPRTCLNLFLQNTENEDWKGQVEHTSMFEVWRKLKMEIKRTENQIDHPATDGNEDQLAEIILNQESKSLTVEETDSAPSTSKINIQSIQIINPHKTPPVTPLPKADAICLSSKKTPMSMLQNNVPTPFKRALFWPEETKTVKKKRYKEKVPAAITSEAWQNYHKKKEIEKKRKLEEKENRAKAREAKKKNKPESTGKKKRQIVQKDSSEEEEEEVWEESGDSLDDISDIEQSVIQENDLANEDTDDNEDHNIGDYLLVQCLGGSRKTTHFRYVCVIQRKFPFGEIEVMSLKCINENKTVFKMVENDIFVIKQEDILKKLPQPEMQNVGDRLKYVFSSPVNIFES